MVTGLLAGAVVMAYSPFLGGWFYLVVYWAASKATGTDEDQFLAFLFILAAAGFLFLCLSWLVQQF